MTLAGGPGLKLFLPIVDTWETVDLRVLSIVCAVHYAQRSLFSLFYQLSFTLQNVPQQEMLTVSLTCIVCNHFCNLYPRVCRTRIEISVNFVFLEFCFEG